MFLQSELCPADDTSVWCPCDETVAEPETEAKMEESVAVRAEKTLKHVFVSKTVRSRRAALLHVRTSCWVTEHESSASIR